MTRLLGSFSKPGSIASGSTPADRTRFFATEDVQALRSQRMLEAGLRLDFAHPGREFLLRLPDIVAGTVEAAYGDNEPSLLDQMKTALSGLVMIELN